MKKSAAQKATEKLAYLESQKQERFVQDIMREFSWYNDGDSECGCCGDWEVNPRKLAEFLIKHLNLKP